MVKEKEKEHYKKRIGWIDGIITRSEWTVRTYTAERINDTLSHRHFFEECESEETRVQAYSSGPQHVTSIEDVRGGEGTAERERERERGLRVVLVSE